MVDATFSASGAMHLTRLEIEALRTGQPLNTTNKREVAEWDEKKKRLGGGAV